MTKKILICFLILLVCSYLKIDLVWGAIAIYVYWKYFDRDEKVENKKEDINTRMQSTYTQEVNTSTPEPENQQQERSAEELSGELIDSLLKHKQKLEQEENGHWIDLEALEEEKQCKKEEEAGNSQDCIQDIDFEVVVNPSVPSDPTSSSSDDVVEEIETSVVDFPSAIDNSTDDVRAASMKERLELLTGCECVPVENNQYSSLVDLFNDYRMDGKSNGYCPMMVAVDDSVLQILKGNAAEGLTGDAEIKQAVEAYHAKMLDQELVDGKRLLANLLEERKRDSRVWNLVTESPKTASLEDLTDGTRFSISDLDEVYVVKVPVSDPWKVWAYVPFGNWNGSPSVEHQMAIAKYWQDAHGAVPAAVGKGFINFVLNRPVYYTRDAALEQYAYCPNIVEQDGVSLALLENSIKNDKVWHFSWN